MLKRRDLVKQFEILVQQEIKNHNNAVLDSNIRINETQKKVSNFHETQNRLVAEINVKLLDIQKELADLRFENSQLHDLSKSQKKQIEKLKDDLQFEKERCYKKFAKNESEVEKLLDLFVGIQESCKAMQESNDCSHKVMRNFVDRSKREILALIEELKSQHDVKPCKRDADISDLQVENNDIKFSIKSLDEEIQANKKKTYYSTKQIEDLYNQLKRLK